MTTASHTFDGIRVRAAQIGLYETPILHGRLADAAALTAALRSAICERHAGAPSLARSNVGGWHSATHMLDWVAVVELADTAVKKPPRGRGRCSLIRNDRLNTEPWLWTRGRRA